MRACFCDMFSVWIRADQFEGVRSTRHEYVVQQPKDFPGKNLEPRRRVGSGRRKGSEENPRSWKPSLNHCEDCRREGRCVDVLRGVCSGALWRRRKVRTLDKRTDVP